MGRDVQRRLVRADRSHLVDDDLPGKPIAEVKRRHRTSTVKLVQPVADAVDLGTEGLVQEPGVAIVVAIGEDHVRRLTAKRTSPAHPGVASVECHALPAEVVGADDGADPLVPGRPMPDSWDDLVHGQRLAEAIKVAAGAVDPSTRM